MAHPHKSQVKTSNSSKMRAITGRGGAGTAYAGMSPFKRAGKHGEQQSFNSHSKGFESGYAHGGAVKARGDRRARGGKTVKSTESMRGENTEKLGMSTPGHFAQGGPIQPPPKPAASVDDKGWYSHGFGAPLPQKRANGGRSKPKHKGDVNIVIMQPHGKPAGGGMPPMGAGAGQGLTGAPSPSPPPPGASASPMAGGQPNPQAAQALQAIAGGGGPGMGGLGALGAGLKAGGGRIKKQSGGAVQPRVRSWQDQVGNQARMPSAVQGAEDYALPSASEREMPVHLPGGSNGQPQPGWKPTGNSDQDGGGMKRGGSSFKFKKGGATWTATRDGRAGGGRTTGEMPGNEAHWAKYSSQNRKSKHGGTGESEELTLSTPEHKEGDIKKADQRARGGRLGTTSKRKGGLPGAGQQSGEARLQQYRKGNF